MRRRTAIVCALLVALVLPGCANNKSGKSDETKRAASLVPREALAFVSITLDPSDAEKSDVEGVLAKFPEPTRKSFNEVKDSALTALVKETGLNYETEVKPWLGSELAVAVLPGGAEPDRVLLIDSKDDKKAAAALQKATSSRPVNAVFRMVNGFAVVAEKEQAQQLDAITKQGQSPSTGLATADKFTRVVDELEPDRLAVAWADNKALGELVNVAGRQAANARFNISGTGDVGPTALDLHATDNGAVVEGVSETPGTTGGGTLALTNALPSSTVAALTAWNLGGLFQSALGTLFQQAAGAVTQLQQAQAVLGFDLVKDLFSWMHGEAVVAVGKPAAAGATLPDLALVVNPTDRAAAQGAIDKIVGLAKSRLGIVFEQRPAPTGGGTMYVLPGAIRTGLQPAMALLPDRFILASSPEYLTTLAKSEGGFDSTKAFADTLGSSKPGTQFQLVLQVSAIRQYVEGLLSGDDKAQYDKDIKPWVDHLSAAAARVRKDGKLTRFEVKVTVD